MNLQNFSTAFLFAVIISSTSISVTAQDRMQYPDEIGSNFEREAAVVIAGDNQFSAKELSKTERGRELVQQLRVLMDTEATMGEKHPLLPKVKEDIEQIKGLLRNRMVAEKIAAELGDQYETKRIATALPGMDDEDLRRLVLRLIVRVDSLEKKVSALNDELGGKSNSSRPAAENTGSMQDTNDSEMSLPEPKMKEKIDVDDPFAEDLFDEA